MTSSQNDHLKNCLPAALAENSSDLEWFLKVIWAPTQALPAFFATFLPPCQKILQVDSVENQVFTEFIIGNLHFSQKTC
jgi:hypothetical protein